MLKTVLMSMILADRLMAGQTGRNGENQPWCRLCWRAQDVV